MLCAIHDAASHFVYSRPAHFGHVHGRQQLSGGAGVRIHLAMHTGSLAACINRRHNVYARSAL
jgi:hypothetical protein